MSILLRTIYLGSVLALSACSGGGSENSPQATPLCTADYEIYQIPSDSNTINLNRQGVYTIPDDIAELSGTMPGHGYSVSWQNITTTSVDLAETVETSEYRCSPGVGCRWFDVTVWFASIPIAFGENSVTVYASDSMGYEQCQDITVTHPSTHAPHSKGVALIPIDTSTQIGDPNVAAVELSGDFENGGLAGEIKYRQSRDSNMVGYAEYTQAYSVTDQHNDILEGYFSNLLPGIEYYFQAVITNSLGSGSSEILSYTTPINDQTQALPEISPNLGPTTITSNSAYIEGYITGNGVAYTHFTEYSSSSSFANYLETTRYTQSNITSSPQSESWTLVGLEPETTYFYRHVAYNGGGTTVSDIHSFTTAAAN